MVVVRCLILCSKFAKNRFSAGLCPDPLRELTALQRQEWEGRGGEERKREKEGREGSGRVGKEREGYPPNEIPGYCPVTGYTSQFIINGVLLNHHV